jgi:hypothetical protein
MLEVNMSPAMAHRSVEQSLLIGKMSHELVSLSILPKLEDEHLRIQLNQCLQMKLNHIHSLLMESKLKKNNLTVQNLEYLLSGKWESLASSNKEGRTFGGLKNRLTVNKNQIVDDNNISNFGKGGIPLQQPAPLSSSSSNQPPQRPKSANPIARRNNRLSSNDKNKDPITPLEQPRIVYSSYYTEQLQQQQSSSPSLEITFTLLGKSISLQEIELVDRFCKRQEKVLFLQK